MMPGDYALRAAAKDEALKPGMAVGLYGGSFDPPHKGHRHVAQTCDEAAWGGPGMVAGIAAPIRSNPMPRPTS